MPEYSAMIPLAESERMGPVEVIRECQKSSSESDFYLGHWILSRTIRI